MSLLLSSWYGNKVGHLSPKGAILWKCILLIVCWSIWKERNIRLFEGKEAYISLLKERAMGLLFWWTSHLAEFLGSNFSMWAFEWTFLVFR